MSVSFTEEQTRHPLYLQCQCHLRRNKLAIPSTYNVSVIYRGTNSPPPLLTMSVSFTEEQTHHPLYLQCHCHLLRNKLTIPSTYNVSVIY